MCFEFYIARLQLLLLYYCTGIYISSQLSLQCSGIAFNIFGYYCLLYEYLYELRTSTRIDIYLLS